MIHFAMEAAMPGAADYISFLPLILLVVLFYFLLIRPQKKREKEDKAMRDSIAVGDRICTIGGILGRVVSLDDDTFTIETGADRNRMKLYRWAVRSKIDKSENEIEAGKDKEDK